jgi:Ran GTPase-activating protein (RanGAP) involved in mRNA processing and transport
MQLKLNKNSIHATETKAIAKILSDFKHIKELDLSDCSLSINTA